MSSRSNLDPHEFLATGTELVETEAICLDERRWDDWLALFMPDCEYWMPAWKSDDTLAADPRTELSYFYYAGRAGLEDRLARIRSPEMCIRDRYSAVRPNRPRQFIASTSPYSGCAGRVPP